MKEAQSISRMANRVQDKTLPSSRQATRSRDKRRATLNLKQPNSSGDGQESEGAVADNLVGEGHGAQVVGVASVGLMGGPPAEHALGHHTQGGANHRDAMDEAAVEMQRLLVRRGRENGEGCGGGERHAGR